MAVVVSGEEVVRGVVAMGVVVVPTTTGVVVGATTGVVVVPVRGVVVVPARGVVVVPARGVVVVPAMGVVVVVTTTAVVVGTTTAVVVFVAAAVVVETGAIWYMLRRLAPPQYSSAFALQSMLHLVSATVVPATKAAGVLMVFPQ